MALCVFGAVNYANAPGGDSQIECAPTRGVARIDLARCRQSANPPIRGDRPYARQQMLSRLPTYISHVPQRPGDSRMNVRYVRNLRNIVHFDVEGRDELWNWQR